MSRRTDLLAVQIRLVAALAGTSSLKEGLGFCLDAAIEVSGLDCGGIYLVDPSARVAKLAVYKGLTKAFVRSQRIHDARSPFLATILEGRAVFSHGGISFKRYGLPESSPERREGLKAVAAYPILAGKKVVACLNVASHTRSTVSREARQSLAAVAAQSGLAVLRLQAESAVRQSEAKYRKLINDAGDAIVMADAETGMILDANIKAAALFGRSLRELRTLHQSELHPAADAARHQQMFRDRVTGRATRVAQARVLRKDGKIIPVEISASLIRIHGRRIMQGFFRNMTERKRAEKREARDRDQMRRLTVKLAETQENERRRIARELHDEVGQALAGLGLFLNKMRDEVPDGHGAELGERLGSSVARIEDIMGRIRSVIADLRPPLLDEYGLAATLEWAAAEFSRTTGLPAKTWIEEGFPRLKPHVEIALIRIVSEALANVQRHARASSVVLSLEADERRVFLMVKDDGAGFAPENTQCAADGGHWGLSIMAERAKGVGGEFRIVSALGAGTRVLVEVPR